MIEEIKEFIRILPVVIVAIVIHEFAHAFAAYFMGDKTAKHYGRMSLNPLHHIDFIGLIFLAIFRFGWSKPVPVNSENFKNYNVGMFVVSIAGIVTNLLFAFICALIIKNVNVGNGYLLEFLLLSAIININLAVFNLIPIPPLDGSNILLSFFSKETAYEISKYQKYTYFLLIALIFSGAITKILSSVTRVVFDFMF